MLGSLGALALGAFATPAAAQQAPAAPSGATLDAIKSRGSLVCGVNTGLAGFAQPDSQGVWRGFDVDYCKAVAAAIFGDASKVRYVPTTAQNRFTALQSGEVDMLARNTTWTLSRDTSLGFDFAATTFYDGQGFMVKTSTGVKSAKELDGATICVQPGTTTEQNLTDWARASNVKFTPVVIERLEELVSAFVAGRCDAYTTDASGLAATRSTQPKPDDYVILPELISKEPLAPAVRQGDPGFADLVRWTHFALVTAEELGIDSKNVDSMASSPNPDIQRFVGKNGDLGKMLGVSNDWAVKVIKAVGNYGEVFDRNLKPIGLPRGKNALWNKDGLQYAPPMR
ncbi:amino acid ABC transporter substrate-binding protein [Roseomonas mucosa]|nr:MULTISPECIES: amino acid ABC transporter substrate-binding protein [Roseomonas]MCG7353325.1 amino acid ABC transporter substrate-binding protein [Roseomonas mucosa]MCG7358352.1 amino acid ABC transporter substrate-binding protein [Roseomonas mucosa]MDT8290138.1 amino acid ABC transporter substrate-binding protein [Roseomonas mucosa]MDT8294080.1 amino acid ABC transporter substrate-binding protein [Roseomonas mucosa]MDT8314834.1 amino acid ABC transporter substrate-binding protein [Roseomona